MSDPNEIEALKAAFRGALHSAEAVAALASRMEALDPRAELPAEELEELGRITAAHAIASAALRGLVNRMMARRGVSSEA